MLPTRRPNAGSDLISNRLRNQARPHARGDTTGAYIEAAEPDALAWRTGIGRLDETGGVDTVLVGELPGGAADRPPDGGVAARTPRLLREGAVRLAIPGQVGQERANVLGLRLAHRRRHLITAAAARADAPAAAARVRNLTPGGGGRAGARSA